MVGEAMLELVMEALVSLPHKITIQHRSRRLSSHETQQVEILLQINFLEECSIIESVLALHQRTL